MGVSPGRTALLAGHSGCSASGIGAATHVRNGYGLRDSGATIHTSNGHEWQSSEEEGQELHLGNRARLNGQSGFIEERGRTEMDFSI